VAGKERKQVLLRLDPTVHAAIAKWAADDLRSVNAQIEVLLRRALDDAGRGVKAAPMRGRGRPRKDGGEPGSMNHTAESPDDVGPPTDSE
jgi:putative AT hook motif protein